MNNPLPDNKIRIQTPAVDKGFALTLWHTNPKKVLDFVNMCRDHNSCFEDSNNRGFFQSLHKDYVMFEFMGWGTELTKFQEAVLWSLAERTSEVLEIELDLI